MDRTGKKMRGPMAFGWRYFTVSPRRSRNGGNTFSRMCSMNPPAGSGYGISIAERISGGSNPRSRPIRSGGMDMILWLRIVASLNPDVRRSARWSGDRAPS